MGQRREAGMQLQSENLRKAFAERALGWGVKVQSNHCELCDKMTVAYQIKLPQVSH